MQNPWSKIKFAVWKITVDLLYAEHLPAFAVVATAEIQVVSLITS